MGGSTLLRQKLGPQEKCLGFGLREGTLRDRTGWKCSEAQRIVGNHTTLLHQGFGDAFKVPEELLLLGV